MDSHGFSWNARISNVESTRHRHAPPDVSVFAPRRVDLPKNVTTWLDSLPSDLRHDDHSCLDKLGDQVVYGQLRDSFARTNLKQTVEFVADLSQDFVDGLERTRFVEVLGAEPRLIELGLLIAFSQLSLTQQIPRDQEFYPAVLLDREVLSVVKHLAERDQPAVSLLWWLVRLHESSLAQQIETSLKDVERGYAKTTLWPSSDLASRLCLMLTSIESLWERLACDLIVATQQTGGRLPMFAVEDAAKPFAIMRAERALIVENINRPRQKRRPVDLLRAAMQWPRRASKILGNLAGNYGSLRLYGAYVQTIWSSVLKGARRHRFDVPTFLEHSAEVLERDIAYPIFAGVEPLEDVVTLFEEACAYDLVRKKRLSRQRERCLRVGLDVVEADFVEMLRDIGWSYVDIEESSVQAGH